MVTQDIVYIRLKHSALEDLNIIVFPNYSLNSQTFEMRKG